ncbi:MAG: NADPH-dependent 7-cyano-7-deazaguanine reductase QueF [Dehalococcoidia bacterium]|nr:NADPH-dependent 7-cyano-7-deazaguanine reductase QueF [Dehalococcoidia bacterium]
MAEQRDDLKARYEALEWKGSVESPEAVDPAVLLAFAYDYPDAQSEVAIDTDEFTAVCPWTGLPDFGRLVVRYVPQRLCVELKALKYYLLAYRNVGIVQEHAANRILRDLVACCKPRQMHLSLDYKPRGGIHTVVEAAYNAEKGFNAPVSR